MHSVHTQEHECRCIGCACVGVGVLERKVVQGSEGRFLGLVPQSQLLLIFLSSALSFSLEKP
jgi:hypothetical protein